MNPLAPIVVDALKEPATFTHLLLMHFQPEVSMQLQKYIEDQIKQNVDVDNGIVYDFLQKIYNTPVRTGALYEDSGPFFQVLCIAIIKAAVLDAPVFNSRQHIKGDEYA